MSNTSSPQPIRAALMRPAAPTALVKAWLAVLLVTVLAGCQATVSTADSVIAPGTAGATYAAFGDSYSAGEGTNSYLAGTDEPGTNVCHRSTVAYSQLIATQLAITSNAFAACSGAVTADMFHPNNNNNREPDGSLEPAQLCQLNAQQPIETCGTGREPVIGPATKLVTLTIGGNDVGLAKVVETCIFGNVGRYRVGLPGRGCRDNPATIDRTLRRIAALAGSGSDTSPYGSQIQRLSAVLAAIHAVAPDAHIYLAGYPAVFQAPSPSSCTVGTATGGTTPIPLKVTAADAKAIDHTIEALNVVIERSTHTAGPWATYVDTTNTFAGHGLCTGSPWINPVTANVSFDPQGRTLSLTTHSGSLHPTRDGQQSGYEAAMLTAGVSAPR